LSAIVRRLRQPIKKFLLAAQSDAADGAWRIEPHELEGVRIQWPRTLEWPYGWGWVEPLFHGFRSRIPVSIIDIPQKLGATVVIEFHRGSRAYRVAINCSDYPDVVYFRSASALLDLEFKMQHRIGGYDEPNIVPGGYVSDSMLVDWYARGPRKERDSQRFQWDVYGRFGVQFATEVRSKAIGLLKGQRRVRFYGGDRKVGFAKFLKEIARSRVCVDLPGNGPFCFRLVNYFAVGACVVSPPHATTMPVPLVDRHHLIYTKADMSDLVDLCEQYVQDDAAREAIMQNAREYYRRNLYWRSLSDYYLRTMLDRLAA
jgi:Glycosyl transferases group 1